MLYNNDRLASNEDVIKKLYFVMQNWKSV